MKNVFLSFALQITLAAGAFASAEPTLALKSSQDQFASLQALKATRAPCDPFPELEPQLTQNITAIRAAITQDLHPSFDATAKEIQTACALGLTLYRFNMGHYVLSYYLQATQKKAPLDLTKVTEHLGYLHDKTNVPARKEKWRVINIISEASDLGLYPYTGVSQDAVFSLDLIHQSCASHAPLCGLPLQMSGFDGAPLADAHIFLNHDWFHIVFNESYTTARLQMAYDAYQKLQALVSAQSCPEAKASDRFCLFYMGHEGNTSFKQVRARPFDMSLSCYYVRTFFRDSLEALDNKIKDGPLRHEILESFHDKTPASLLAESAAPKDAPFDWLPLLESILKTKKGSIFHSDYQLEATTLSFDFYNTLFEIKESLEPAGIPFPIWKEDGTFNGKALMDIIKKALEDFEGHYTEEISQERN